ncbi:hypothetical protein [Streptomyces hygroscopicus]|uniref:hypothetical protein n=1 Tax=Streptomyces hygroscopicus TaxID=1912 RepID=UPI00207BC605|nr:hypothetical protein [Streptomyces hygroscopicus]
MDEGEHHAKVLHEELRTKGYLGHYQRVKMAIAPLRRGLPFDQPRERPPSPRETTRWIISRPDKRHLYATERLDRLLDHCPELQHTYDLVRRFAAMLDNRDATPLPAWLDALFHSGLAPVCRCCRSSARRPACRRPGDYHPPTAPATTRVESPT